VHYSPTRNLYWEKDSSTPTTGLLPVPITTLGSLADLSEELTAHRKVNPDSGILLSSETFEALSVVEFAYLYEFLKKIDDVKVVLLLRRQDEYLLSYWSMLVKSLKVSQPFGIWAREQIQIDNDVNNTFSYGLDYYKFINKLISVVGVSNIKVRGYTEMTTMSFGVGA